MTIKVFSVAEMIAAEKAADLSGVSYDQMMETAGRRVAEAIVERTAVAGKSVLILIGPGNNGGDGLVAGRFLAQEGSDVAFYMYRARDPQQDENFRLVRELGLFVIEAEHDQRYRVLRTRLMITDILIDALLGTGVTRAIEGELGALMKQVKPAVLLRRSEPAPSPPLSSISQPPSLPVSPVPRDVRHAPLIVAVDCPSGLNCDSGELDRLAINADLSVTFAGPKRGHFRFPGAEACGELIVADIGIEDTLPEVTAVQLTLVTPQMVGNLLPNRPSDGHKGTFGTVLIAAGSADYWGAPVLSGLAAYRSGAGLVALAVPEKIRAAAAAQIPEATFPTIAAGQYLDAESAEFLIAKGTGAQSMLVGPGIGQADSFVEYLLSTEAPMPPLVVDADGLNILATISNWYEHLPANSILTPHPGEMARLSNLRLEAVKTADRVELARQSARDWGHIVLLKGAYTVIASPTGDCALLPFANPLLAVAGSGDVLAGMIAAYLAQGLEPFEAAVIGGYLHGSAGELARKSYGEAGMLAVELANMVPAARRRLDEGA